MNRCRRRIPVAIGAVIAASTMFAACGGDATKSLHRQDEDGPTSAVDRKTPDPGNARTVAADACVKTARAYSAARPVISAVKQGDEPPSVALDRATELILAAQELADRALALDERWAGLASFARLLGLYDVRSQRAFYAVADICDTAGLTRKD